MKYAQFLIPFAAICGFSLAEVEWNGYILQGSMELFALSDTTQEGKAAWVRLGGEFAGYKLLSFDDKSGTLRMSLAGAVVEKKIKESKVRPTPADFVDPSAMTDADLSALGLYRIKAGDTGLKIARAAKITLPELRVLNPETNWTGLKVGQIVVVASSMPPNQSLEPTATAVTSPAAQEPRQP